MPTTTKKELTKILADELGMTALLAGKCVDALFLALKTSIVEGNRIEVRGFGAWEVKETKFKPHARNPKTGEVIAVPARRKVRFKVGKELKKELTKPREVGE
jgi:nucleoid DNA-binding protein